MGYACPVCEAPQADAAHLANHLAFTAILGDDDHEAWLDRRVPDWADRNPETLGPAVARHAPERDLEGTTATADPGAGEHDHPDHHDHEHHEHHDHGSEHGSEVAPRFESDLARRSGYGRNAGAAEVDRVLAEARDLTEQMRGDRPLGGTESGGGDGDGEDADGEGDAASGSGVDSEDSPVETE